MQLRDFVVGQVFRRVPARAQSRRHVEGVFARSDAEAHEDVGLVAAAEPIVELRHHPAADGGAELAEGARPLGDGDAQDGLARLSQLGAFGHEAQPVEVHVRAAQDRHRPLVARDGARRPDLEAGHGQGARRLQHAARVGRRRP